MLAALRRLVSGRSGPRPDRAGWFRRGSGPGWSRAAQLWVAAALAGCTAYGGAVIWGGLGRLSAIPQDWDAVFHANGIRYIAETGDSSLVGMGSINWFENGVQVFYPNAYHLIGALVLRLTGADVPTVLNAHTVLLPGMCALVIIATVRRFGRPRGAGGGRGDLRGRRHLVLRHALAGPAAPVRHRGGVDAAGRDPADGPAGRAGEAGGGPGRPGVRGGAGRV